MQYLRAVIKSLFYTCSEETEKYVNENKVVSLASSEHRIGDQRGQQQTEQTAE